MEKTSATLPGIGIWRKTCRRRRAAARRNRRKPLFLRSFEMAAALLGKMILKPSLNQWTPRWRAKSTFQAQLSAAKSGRRFTAKEFVKWRQPSWRPLLLEGNCQNSLRPKFYICRRWRDKTDDLWIGLSREAPAGQRLVSDGII